MTGFGASNPNFKNAGWKVCHTCGRQYHSYQKTRRFCSLSCRSKAPQNLARLVVMSKMPRKPRVKRGRKPRKKTYVPRPKRPDLRDVRYCAYCHAEFRAYPSNPKKYCSYQCHLESGGAQRAGAAAVRSRMRYTGHKKDANHDAVVAAFKELGCSVLECHSIGIPGFPDLVVGCMNNNYMVEIKNRKTAYGRRGLNEKQKKFSGQWRGAPVLVVGSEDEVAELVNEWRGHKATVKTPDEAIQEVLRHTGER